MGDVVIDRRENKNGTFSYQYRFEIASVDGKRRWKTKSGFKTKREAREEAKKAQQAYEQVGQVVEPSDISYSDFLDMFIEKDCILTCKESTLNGYKKKIRLYIKPKLGSYKLKSITKETLQDFITGMYNRGFSVNTVGSIKGLITKSFKFALDKHYIISTPAINLVIPTKMQPEVETNTNPHVYIPKDIMQKIFERFPEGTSAYIPLMIGYHTGLRLGEIYALVWEDIDFENKTLSVNRQVQWDQGKKQTEEERKRTNGTSKSNGFWYFTEPKYDSYRTIEIDDTLLEILQKERKKQLKAKNYYEEYYNRYFAKNPIVYAQAKAVIPMNKISQTKTHYEIDFVCRRENGSYITSRTTQHISQVVHKQLNFPEYDTHSLRHTHGTMLRENGADFVYIQKRLGHKDLKTTILIYTNHLTDTIKENGDIALNNIFKS